jgi:uncharacterized protein
MARPLRWLMLPLLAALLWLALLAALWWRQEALLFHPQPLRPGHVLAQPPDVLERTVQVPGASLSVLELRLAQPRGVVFYLHGNAGNLKTWFIHTEPYRKAGLDLVMMDYRGYGKSTGRIGSEAELHADVRAVWDSVAARYAGQRVVLLGRSLGTGLAARLASELQPDLTVLVTPYLSLQALADEHYPWVPSPILRYPMLSHDWLARVRTPVMLLHGDADALIPLSHSQRLLRSAARGRLVVIPSAGHNDIHQFPAYREALDRALATFEP